MKLSEKYTNDEWKTIASIPNSVGAIMASAGFSGLIGSGKEMFASVRGIMDAKKEFANNLLIQEILPNFQDREDAMTSAKEQRTYLMNKIKANDVKSSEALQAIILEDCKKSIALIEAKEDAKTVSEYKKWILDVAEGVANAAKEGGFLFFGGERFSEKEQVLYKKLKEVLA